MPPPHWLGNTPQTSLKSILPREHFTPVPMLVGDVVVAVSKMAVAGNQHSLVPCSILPFELCERPREEEK